MTQVQKDSGWTQLTSISSPDVCKQKARQNIVCGRGCFVIIFAPILVVQLTRAVPTYSPVFVCNKPLKSYR